MGVLSTKPTSRRGYVSQAELEQLADITITDIDEADDRISQAEEIIDAYVGPQDKFLDNQITGLAAAGGSSNITLETSHRNNYDVNYFKLCEVEIIGGTGEGQRRKVISSTKEGVLTVDSAWDTTPDSTSFYKIYQLGKFPRKRDVISYSTVSPTTYLKSIPEVIKRAVAAQVEFSIEMGDDFFKGEKVTIESETIGDYSYNLSTGMGNLSRLISPKAKLLLRGIKNRVGKIVY